MRLPKKRRAGTVENLPAAGSPQREALNRYLARKPMAVWSLVEWLTKDGVRPPGKQHTAWTLHQAASIIRVWGHMAATDVPGTAAHLEEPHKPATKEELEAAIAALGRGAPEITLKLQMPDFDFPSPR